jgi:aryl-alcohol dehydrogenase-like predicted oxidoreductase
MQLDIEPRHFGNTGLRVSALGYGGGHIGSADLSESQAETLLNTVVDAGITFIDTARSYGLSEERIGRYLCEKRRDEITLSTKVGYGIDGVPDWSFDAVYRGIDEARARLRTDIIDIVHLHSCDAATIEAGAVTEALHRAREEGKIRVAAYSGENEDLRQAIYSHTFGAAQASVNIFDQKVLYSTLPMAKQQFMGFIAKRPLGNAPWRFDQTPVGHYCEVYWHRMKSMGLDFGAQWAEIALRFTVFRFGVDTAIVGSTSIANIHTNIAITNKGRLDDDILYLVSSRFAKKEDNWNGQI